MMMQKIIYTTAICAVLMFSAVHANSAMVKIHPKIAISNLNFVKTQLFDKKVRSKCDIDIHGMHPKGLEIIKKSNIKQYFPYHPGNENPQNANASALMRENFEFYIMDEKYYGTLMTHVSVHFEGRNCMISVGYNHNVRE
jgi:hypothetical protein